MIKNIMKNIGVKSENPIEEARKKLLDLEKVRRSKTDSLEENKIRLEQAKLLETAGFNTRKDFDEYIKYYYRPMKNAKKEDLEFIKVPAEDVDTDMLAVNSEYDATK